MRTPLLLTALSLALLPTVPADAGSWSRSWMAAPLVSRAPADKRPELTDRTVRQVVRISSGGDRIRLRLSNEMSTEPLQLGAVHVALAGEDGRILPGTDHVVSFNGAQGAVIPAPASPSASTCRRARRSRPSTAIRPPPPGPRRATRRARSS